MLFPCFQEEGITIRTHFLNESKLFAIIFLLWMNAEGTFFMWRKYRSSTRLQHYRQLHKLKPFLSVLFFCLSLYCKNNYYAWNSCFFLEKKCFTLYIVTYSHCLQLTRIGTLCWWGKIEESHGKPQGIWITSCRRNSNFPDKHGPTMVSSHWKLWMIKLHQVKLVPEIFILF